MNILYQSSQLPVNEKEAEVNRMPNERLQQELAEKLSQIPPEAEALVMSMLLNNVSTLLSGMEIGKQLEQTTVSPVD
jgi:hypothetical protein